MNIELLSKEDLLNELKELQELKLGLFEVEKQVLTIKGRVDNTIDIIHRKILMMRDD